MDNDVYTEVAAGDTSFLEQPVGYYNIFLCLTFLSCLFMFIREWFYSYK